MTNKVKILQYDKSLLNSMNKRPKVYIATFEVCVFQSKVTDLSFGYTPEILKMNNILVSTALKTIKNVSY